MTTTVFGDAFYYFAFLNASDEAHEGAVAFTDQYAGKIVTTAWVLTELADGLAAPVNRGLFLRTLAALKANPRVTIVPPNVELFEAAIRLYEERPDKNWSLTDCISFEVM